MPISLILFSSAEISLPLFEKLIDDERFEIKALFCQPDKAAGRNLELKAPAPKLLAESRGIPVYQPEKLSVEIELLDKLREDAPDFILTFAYGQIMNQDWLDLPRLAPLNVHTSLLPKHRGASPIQAALLNGDRQTGISLMKMVREMDAGPVAFQDEISIDYTMNAGMLHDRLSELAAENVPDHIVKLSEDLTFVDQDEASVTHCGKVSREDGYIDFTESSVVIARKLRAYSPWPGVWTTFSEKRLKILDAEMLDAPYNIGEVQEGLIVGCSEGSLKINRLQLEGKKVLDAKDFLLGQSDFVGSVLPS